MKKNYFFLIALIATSLSFGQVINEIDVDTPGTDAAEFIEIFWTPNTALDGLVVVLFNGSSDTSYAAYDLDGKTTDANGFFILANTALISGSDIDMGASNSFQNGADAIAIYTANDTDFPTSTPATATNLVDALVYDTNDGDDAALLATLGETIQYNEDENSAKDTQSIQRKTDGTYEVKNITFRADNNAATCDLSLTSNTATCDAFTAGTDTYTAIIDFVGGGTATYNVVSDFGTIGGDDPGAMATGTIIVTGINEGTDVTVTVTDTGVLCNLNSTISSPVCAPSLNLPLYEDFNYTTATNLGDQTNWVNNNSGDDIVMVSGSLSYPNLVASSGNSITFDANGMDPSLSFTPATTGEVYASFIFRITDQSAITDLTDGGYFASIANSNSSYDARLWVRPNPSAASNTFDIGIGNTGAPTVSPGTYTTNTDIFVIMSYDIATGNINTWINPNSADLGGSAPTATISATDASPAASISKFILRQDSSGETPFIQFDELRIGTSWSDVTPNTLSIADHIIEGFKIFPNPTNENHINIKTANNSPKNVKVFDMLGKKIIDKEIDSKLSISALQAGIYIVKITENNLSATKRLIVK